MTTNVKPTQFSLRMLLGAFVAASVVMAIYAAVRSVIGTAAVVWVLASLAHACLSLYGFSIRRTMTENWRFEFSRYATLGLLMPGLFACLFIVLLLAPYLWPLAVACLFVAFPACALLVAAGYVAADHHECRSSSLLWWLRFAALGKAALLVVIIFSVIGLISLFLD